ncbi:hypothetical protein Q1695_016307 [Nippostrongylus brasiliensis]|nr:hypothetical protein Q1695_016307 [Nippostrongylus brasiliensis]
MSASEPWSGAESRAASPEDENGKPQISPPVPSNPVKIERYADLKRRSAYAFSIFANEEREKLLQTHPDLPMGIVTRMMVEKWKSLNSESKAPYFDAARTSPLRTKKPADDTITPPPPIKKMRSIMAYQTALPSQVKRVDPTGQQQQQQQQRQGKVFVLQGKPPGVNADVVKPRNPSVISASIAQALGMTITAPQRTTAPSAATPVATPTTNAPRAASSALRLSVLRSKPSSSSAQQPTSVVTKSEIEAPKSQSDAPYGFASSEQALEMFYLALCEPAFPHPDEPPLTPYPANYCYDAYMRMISDQSRPL